MKKILIIAFNQMGDIEFTSFYDVIQRYGHEVDFYNVSGTKILTTKFGLEMTNSKPKASLEINDYDALYIPGGPGVEKVLDNQELKTIILEFNRNNKLIIAICAAPKILAAHGLLINKKIIAFRSQEIYNFLETKGAIVVNKNCQTNDSSCHIVKDGNIITGMNYETTIALAKYVAKEIKTKDKINEV